MRWLEVPAWLRRRFPFGGRAADGFCAMPFKNLFTMPNGHAKPCCMFEGVVTAAGRPMSIHESSVEDVWNSEHMRAIRRRTAEGKPVDGCGICYVQEAKGLVSARKTITDAWAGGWINPERKTPAGVVRESSKNGFRATLETVDILLGSACNLKCRMCDAGLSSAIENDRVHSKWAPPMSSMHGHPREGSSWAERKKRWTDDLLRDPKRLRNVTLIGGETLILKETKEIMEVLIDAGAAERTILTLATNATTVSEGWCELAARFKSLSLTVSIEGYGVVNDYIRYPARWADVEAGLRRLQRLPNASVAVNTTVQAYNMLDLAELARFCETAGVLFHPNALEWPAHLSSFIMPAPIRRGAARRLRDYAIGRPAGCRPQMLALAEAWESAPDADPALLREFMVFTNDLDASRGQSFAASLPELAEMLRVSGVPWTDERRFSAAEPE